LAHGIAATRDLSGLPILADALMDAGCDDQRLLGPCRHPRRQYPDGWWVIDLVLAEVADEPSPAPDRPRD
jgi:hypothetical protein